MSAAAPLAIAAISVAMILLLGFAWVAATDGLGEAFRATGAVLGIIALVVVIVAASVGIVMSAGWFS